MNSNHFLKGSKIFLRPLTIKDIEGPYYSWLNNLEIVEFNSHGRFPMTDKKLQDYVNRSQDSNSFIVLAIEDISTKKHIGNISLQGINWIDRNAEIAFLLGEKDYWGKGVMFEAGTLMINHAFKGLNLHRVYCGTSSANKAMQRLAQKLGMKQEGVRKEAIFSNGKYFDIIEYGIINPA